MSGRIPGLNPLAKGEAGKPSPNLIADRPVERLVGGPAKQAQSGTGVTRSLCTATSTERCAVASETEREVVFAKPAPAERRNAKEASVKGGVTATSRSQRLGREDEEYVGQRCEDRLRALGCPYQSVFGVIPNGGPMRVVQGQAPQAARLGAS